MWAGRLMFAGEACSIEAHQVCRRRRRHRRRRGTKEMIVPRPIHLHAVSSIGSPPTMYSSSRFMRARED